MHSNMGLNHLSLYGYFVIGGKILMENEEKRKRRIYLLIILVLLLLLIGAVIYIFTMQTDKPPQLQQDENAVVYDGDKSTYHLPNGQKGIGIPGIESLVFQKGTTIQQVNFFNPDGNDCLFLMTLLVDGEEYWRSGYCNPGTGYYEIELTKSISEGDYSGTLKVECYREDGTELNGANVEFKLYVR